MVVAAEPGAWALEEFGGIRLGDARLERRAVEIAERLAMLPGASLSRQMASPARLKATYRMVDNEKVTCADLQGKHWENTRQAASKEPLVLQVMDVTEADFTRFAQTMANVGYLREHARGFLVHSTLTVLPDPRQVIGLAYQLPFERIPIPEGEDRKERPKEERESRVWGEALEAIGRVPEGCRQVVVADRACDHAEFLLQCQEWGYDYVVRLAYNRRLVDEPGEEPQYLLTTARTWEPVVGRYVDVPADGKRKARRAKLLVSYGRGTVRVLHRPETISLYVVRVWEVEAPEGEEPLEWLLATSVPVECAEDALERIDWYTCRWVVEDYHQCLKTGCGMEEHDFEDQDRAVRLLGFCGPIAVRLLQLRENARLNPELPASAVADDLTIGILAAEVGAPAETMTVRAFWRGVARLGGFLGRRRDGEPGWKSLWAGWLQLEAQVRAVRRYSHLYKV